MRRRPALSVASISALVIAGLAVPLAGAPTARAEPPRTATARRLPAERARLPRRLAARLHRDRPRPAARHDDVCRDFTVPAGSYELKVAINHSWDESYGQGSANVPLVLGGAATLRFTYDDTTHAVGIAPTDLPGGATAADAKLATSSLRELATQERFYFVMADRFANGDTANDRGGLTGTRLETGFDPTDAGFYHGGDLKGIAQRLDYIKGLGTTAIWLTPSFKNRPVQGTGSDASAGYHGYWVTDFTQIDPHLGTNADMKTLIAAAHAKGMKVYFDIITNHTADVVDYDGGQHGYVYKEAAAYKDANGMAFDDAAVAGKPACSGTAQAYPACFPALSPTLVPVHAGLPRDADKNAKVPAWLNDPTIYHNRGDSTFAGESSTYGDFVGLDDLFTEHADVVVGHGGHLQVLGRLRHRRLPHRHRQARQHGVLAGLLARNPQARQGDR